MTYTRDPAIAALIDEVVSMAPPPPDLPNASARSRNRRRSALIIGGLVCASALAALLIAEPWSSSTRKPSIVAPAITGPEPQIPLLVPGPDATIDRVDIDDIPTSPLQPVPYVQEYSAGTSDNGPYLEVSTVDFSPAGKVETLEDLGCNPAGDPGLAAGHQHDGEIISLGSLQACLITNVAGSLSLNWVDTDGVSVSLRSAGLSIDELESIGRGVRRTAGTQRVQVPLLRGLEEVSSGEIPQRLRTVISFRQGTCTYELVVGDVNPATLGFGGEPVDVNGTAGRIHENVLNWNPTSGSTAGLLGHVGHTPDDSATTAATECDLAGVARQVVQTDRATWQRTLDALGDRVHRAAQ